MIAERIVKRGHRQGRQVLCAYCWLDRWQRLIYRWR